MDIRGAFLERKQDDRVGKLDERPGVEQFGQRRFAQFSRLKYLQVETCRQRVDILGGLIINLYRGINFILETENRADLLRQQTFQYCNHLRIIGCEHSNRHRLTQLVQRDGLVALRHVTGQEGNYFILKQGFAQIDVSTVKLCRQ